MDVKLVLIHRIFDYIADKATRMSLLIRFLILMKKDNQDEEQIFKHQSKCLVDYQFLYPN